MNKLFLSLILALSCVLFVNAQGLDPQGDVNRDGVVDVNDVTYLVEYLLNGQWPSVNEFTVNGVTFNMVRVPGGTFTMGATAEQGTDFPFPDEYPTHQVTLSGYSIGQTEVTQELWMAVMGSNPSQFTGDPKRPVENVSWEDCQEFIAKLNELTGKHFRLPTEAEWEFAARGGNVSMGFRFAGSNTCNDVAWNNINASDVGTDSPDFGTHAVATKPANELGLYDMSGNVYEWCNDWYDAYNRRSQTDPQGPDQSTPNIGNPMRVRRGGCWQHGQITCRVSYRGYANPVNKDYCGGLRLAH